MVFHVSWISHHSSLNHSPVDSDSSGFERLVSETMETIQNSYHLGCLYDSVAELDLDDVQLEKPGAYSSLQAYKNSKTANVSFSLSLAKRLAGSGVSVNVMCPGM